MANLPAVLGQGFNSGSDGSMGALVVSNNLALDVPPDGKFHFTTITINGGRILTFNRNAMSTPVYLLATSNVTILGTIDISGGSPTALTGGRGGPGGFDGGAPDGAGHGPGGGLRGVNANSAAGAGSGSYSTQSSTDVSTNKGATYGSPLLVPMVGGSGGGGRGDSGGGGGGGAIVVASSTRIDIVGTGRILAEGGFVNGNARNWGSGGAVRLVAPVVAGTGTINVTGSGMDNLGRVRIDAIDRSGIAFNLPSSSLPAPLSIGAFMTVFPPGNPRLDIIEVAGIPIPEGTNSPVSIILPVGSNPNRTVVVQARNFGFLVQDESSETLLAVEVVLTPDTGRPTSQFGFMSARSNPNTVSVPVTFPINTPVTVSAWQR